MPVDDGAPAGQRTAPRITRALSRAVLGFTLIATTAFLAESAFAATPNHSSADVVYVTNLTSNTVRAVNPATRAVTVIRGPRGSFNGPLGIAITPDGSTAYVTNSLGDTVTPINLLTHPATVGTPIRVGSGPSAIAITANGRFAYVTNFNSNSVTPINLLAHPASVERSIHVGVGPWSLALSPTGSLIIVSNSESSTVSVIATATSRVTTLQVGSRPQAIAVTPNGASAYVASGNDLTPLDLKNTPVTVGAPIRVGAAPLGIAISPRGNVAYTANSDGTVTPVRLKASPASPGTPVAVGTLSQPDGVAINSDGTIAYSANADNTVSVINLTTSPISTEPLIQVGTPSFGIAISPNQAPIARLTVTTSPSGKRTMLSASSSTSPGGRIVRYAWNFGDGTTAVTTRPVISHVYVRPATYHVSVVETNAGGTSVATTYTGQTVSNNGSPLARASIRFQVPASLQLNPAAGSPGIAFSLRDALFTGSCHLVNVFFGSRLVAQVAPVNQLLYAPHLVVPGNASLGTHRVTLRCAATGRSVLATSFPVVAAKNHLSEFSVAMPTAGQIRRSLPAAGAISVIMLLLSRLIGAGFPSEWIDRTYEENRERFTGPLRRKFPRLFTGHDVTRSTARRFLGGAAIFLAFIAFGGFVNSVLNPAFGFNRTTLWLFIGQCIGIGVVSITGQIPTVVSGLRQHRAVHLQVLLGGLIIAVACVAASRAIGLSPGYCYGLIATFLLVPEHDDKDRGRLHALGSVCVLVVSTAAFFLTIPVFHAATSTSPSTFSLILDPALNVIFLAGFASLAFGMFPLPFLPGRHVAKWNQTIWLAISGLGLIGFVAVLLAPGSGSRGEVHHVGLVPIVVAFIVFAIISLGAMLWFHRHPMDEEENQGAEAVSRTETSGDIPLAGT